MDDIMDVEVEEFTEDFHKFGSFQSAVVNPLKERVFNLYKNRIIWLLALVFMNIFSGAALASFEDVIKSVVALPFIFTKLRLDPATASAPLITSIADICGVIIYFSIANWFFGF